jgi:hypothetical protein
MESKNWRALLLSGVVAFIGFAAVPIQDPELIKFCEMVSTDSGVLNRIISANISIDRKAALPKKITITNTMCVDPTKPDILRITVIERELAPIQSGIINVISKVMGPKGEPIYVQLVSFMGLVDLGFYGNNNIKIELPILGGVLPALLKIGPTREVSANFSMTSGLVRLEADLEKIINPTLNEHFPLTTSTTVKMKTRSFSSENIMDLTSKERVEATKFHPSLSGFAKMIVCNGKTDKGKSFTRTYAFFEDYKWYFLVKSEGENGINKETQSITSIN